MDLQGLNLGFLFFFGALFIAFFLLKIYGLTYKNILLILLLSAIGHFLGGIAYWWYALTNGADAVFYFKLANIHSSGLSYHFTLMVLGYLKLFLIGDSFLAAFLFFAAIGFLGSVVYFLAFKQILDVCLSNSGILISKVNPRILLFPAIIFLCWPSYFFWSAGLVKDSFIFLFIGILFLYSASKFTPSKIIFLFGLSITAFILRPYILIVIFFSWFLYVLLKGRIKFGVKIFLILFLFVISYKFFLVFSSYAAATGLSSFSMHDIAERAIINQQYMNVGSSIPVPTKNPYLMYLFIPYLLLANLCLPLFVGGANFIWLISSCENVFLLYLIVKFLKDWKIWQLIKKKASVLNFFMIYFFVGMAFLGMINTNVGLAMREKMMYVPGLLIIILLTFTYKKILMQKT